MRNRITVLHASYATLQYTHSRHQFQQHRFAGLCSGDSVAHSLFYHPLLFHTLILPPPIVRLSASSPADSHKGIILMGGNQAYARLAHEDTAGHDFDMHEPEAKCWARFHQYTAQHSSWAISLSLALFGLSIFFFIISASLPGPTDLQCDQRMSAYSPAQDAVEYEWVTFENDFFHDSIYRGTPTPELEKAWDDLWDYGAFSVPEERLPALNKSTTGWREIPKELGGGVAGLLEGFHQIHCLNLIRQYTYRDVYDYSHLPSFDGTPLLVRKHIDHCIEILRVNLMCTADTTPYLIAINPNRRYGEDPDFNTLHKCRNWDKIVSWAKNHELFRDVDPDHIHAVKGDHSD